MNAYRTSAGAVALVAWIATSACGPTLSVGQNETDGGSHGTTSASGTVSGVAFNAQSAYAKFDSDKCVDDKGNPCPVPQTLGIIFSSESRGCDGAKAKTVIPGATYTMFYRVPRALGTYAVPEAKYAVVDGGCNGTINASKAGRASAKDASITITRLDATIVEGTVTATYDDGSSFSGNFSVGVCASELDEDNTCAK